MLLSCVTSCTAQHTVVYGTAGGDILLPCNFQVDPKGNLNELTISWEYIIGEDNKKVVHSYDQSKDQPKYQDMRFKGRTKFFHAELKKRNASLLLRDLTEADQGTYECVIDLHRVQRCRMFLNVTGKQEHINPTIRPKNLDSAALGHPVITVVPSVVVPIIILILICTKYGKKLGRKFEMAKKKNASEDSDFLTL
nr:PREDICTED: CD276 antigen homolog [Latimeria chalumnae]|eukprot:XP_006007717.1 PREDICTED: CD276 antigen homolog [Latimeria chalumnae]